MRLSKSVAFAAIAALPFTAARADEGMWTIDGFPAAKMKADYGWAPDQAWLDKVRSAAVRLTGGCSASFVSSKGLILTNHHCVADCLQDLSSAKVDYLKNGYTAAAATNEKREVGLGLTDGENVQITAGLAAGDEILQFIPVPGGTGADPCSDPKTFDPAMCAG